MKKQSIIWGVGFAAIVLGALTFTGMQTITVDPFFHYHQPKTDTYYYELDNQRSQNDGILRNFTYDALITGTSMTENFKSTELDELLGVHSVKVPYSGGTYRELDEVVRGAIKHNPDLKMVVRGLDMSKIMEDKDLLREDMGEYPDYLYDDNIFNDVKYIFNRDVIFRRVDPMIVGAGEGKTPGITSFDEYANWMNLFTFGHYAVCPNGISTVEPGDPVYLTDEEKVSLQENIDQNLVNLVRENPDITFYYYFTPYSVIWWQGALEEGSIYREIEIERIVMESLLDCPNVKLYSISNRREIITDLNNYKDSMHHGSWINSLLLRYMKEGEGLLTRDNYEQVLADELSLYTSFDYDALNEQPDYENDYLAEALWNKEISKVSPVVFDEDFMEAYFEFRNADTMHQQHGGTIGFSCVGRLERAPESDPQVAEYMWSREYIGGKVRIPDMTPFRELVFWGRKYQDQGQPTVVLYSDNGEVLKQFALDHETLDDEWHEYVLRVDELSGPVTVLFNGGYVDTRGSEFCEYFFSDITLY